MDGPDKRLGMGNRPRLRRGLRVLMIALLALVLLPYALTPIYAVVDPVSTAMLGRRMSGARVERHPVPLSRISPALPLTVIIAEDGRFCSHHGVDLTEIREAIAEADDFDGMRGGSTITQQLAKNLFLWQGRSYVRKALEFPLALWIDLVLPKRRIMSFTRFPCPGLSIANFRFAGPPFCGTAAAPERLRHLLRKGRKSANCRGYLSGGSS